MMKLSSSLWILSLATLAACGLGNGNTDDDDTGLDTDTADTDDTTETDTDETDIVDVTPEWNEAAWSTGWEDFVDCSQSGEVTFSAETKNWGFDAALYLSQTRFYGAFSAWDELHTLDEESASGNNDGEGFSVFERTLTTGATTGNQTADTSTLFKCSPGTPSLDPSDSGNFQVSFALAVWGENDDSSTDDPTDCIVFGQDAQELLDNGYTGGTGSGAGRTLPAWFNATNCRIVD